MLSHVTKSTLFLILTLFCLPVLAAGRCTQAHLASHPQEAIGCYLNLPEENDTGWVLDTRTHDKRGVTVERYTLATQFWPKPRMSAYGTTWEQQLVIYRPDLLQSDQALLFVNGGTRHADYTRGISRAMELDFARMAAGTHSVVVDLQDVPNQYIALDDHVKRREDGLVAYTWNRYLHDANHNPYWLLQLPMTKAVVKAMNATQQIVASETGHPIRHFVVSGASKRGWVTWLTALNDNRVNAIVPIVIDILKTRETLNHIYLSYNQTWPVAFIDYNKENIPSEIFTPRFNKMTDILDPIAYLHCDNCQYYRNRMSIPKYIISASGDDFFVPDASTLYIDDLPGENILRVTPNQSHSINSKLVDDALLMYYASIVNHTQRPHIDWEVGHDGTLLSATVTHKPKRVLLWEARNLFKRDFRMSSGVTYHSKKLTSLCEGKSCAYYAQIRQPEKGYKADFIEATYENSAGQQFTITTPVYIIGKGPNLIDSTG